VKTLVFVATVTIVAVALRILVFGWPEQIYLEERTSPSGLEYVCMYASEDEFTIITSEEDTP
jgi:hypothetical protein